MLNDLARVVIQTGAEAREGFEFLELGVSELEVARDRAVSRPLGLATTRETDLPTSTAGSTPNSNNEGER